MNTAEKVNTLDKKSESCYASFRRLDRHWRFVKFHSQLNSFLYFSVQLRVWIKMFWTDFSNFFKELYNFCYTLERQAYPKYVTKSNIFNLWTNWGTNPSWIHLNALMMLIGNFFKSLEFILWTKYMQIQYVLSASVRPLKTFTTKKKFLMYDGSNNKIAKNAH